MREIFPINFNWYFKNSFNENFLKNLSDLEGFVKVDIPHNKEILPFNYLSKNEKESLFTYKKEIFIDEKYRGKIIKLIFEGVAHKAFVYINETKIGEHSGGYDEFYFEISSKVKYGENNYISVVVDSSENPNIPPFGNVVDYLGYGGIYREVRLEVLEYEHIINAFLKNENIENNIINCKVETTASHGVLGVTVFSDSQEVYQNEFPIESSNIAFKINLKEKELWDLNNPHLYNIKFKLLIDGKEYDEIFVRFGFRKVLFTPDGFYLNNKKIKLRGLNRHQSYPYVGYAMPKRIQEKDADILKFDLGVNIVRTSHYMQSRHFLNRCDEIGLLVFEEIPGWQYIGGQEFKENTLNNVKAMIERDYNHPSIIMWGVRINESPDDDELYKKTNELAHSLDDSRPTGGVRNFLNSNMFEDVYTFNDFVHSGGKEILREPNTVKKGVPYLVTEFNGHMFPTKKYDDEPHRIEHALRHYRVINQASKNDKISGTIGWCMNDYNTHEEFGSGDKVCYHGVLDMYRLPKYASYIYSSQQDYQPILEVLSTINFGDYPAGLMKNIYVATNFEYIKLYKDGEYIKTFYPEKESKLPHPIIIIDDLIGDQLIEKEGFSIKDSNRAKDLFFAVSEFGYNLPLKYKLLMLLIMKNNKLKLNDAVNLYFKYSLGNHKYRFDGYKNNELKKSVIKENVDSVKYKLEADTKELVISETYDAVRIVLSKLDQNDNILSYAFDPLTVKVDGGIDLIGPSLLSLSGGSIAFWVKTNGLSNDGQIEVTINDITLRENIKIKK